MHVEYEIRGRFEVPEGTRLLPRISNRFELPSGVVISVQPVIEMASSTVADDHRDLTYAEAAALGVVLDLYDRDSSLL
jgi:hypothetical protein